MGSRSNGPGVRQLPTASRFAEGLICVEALPLLPL
jgi:hypothetical protein